MPEKLSLHDQQLSQITRSETLKKWLRRVIVAHVIILVVGAIGLPHLRPKPMDLTQAVSVDLVAPRSEFSAAPNKTKFKQPPKPQVKPKEIPPKDVTPPEAQKPAPVKSDAAKKEDVPKPAEELEKPKEKTEKPKKDATEPADKKEIIKKDPKKKDVKDDNTGKEKEQEDFNSLLKNLLANEEQPAGNPVDAPVDEETPVSGSAPVTAETLSISDMDALKYQLAKCWNIPSGAMNAEELIVDIRIEVNEDRTVKTAEIVDQARYRTDSFFAAAADSARRAVFNPMCSPLALPPEKYDVWKTLLIRFNPRDMFGG